MSRKWKIVLFVLCAAFLLGGCTLRTVDEMYCLPKRSESYKQLQLAIDAAMENMDYAAPVAGENQQTVQMADLTGDGIDEYILFARSKTDKPLQILIFTPEGSDFRMMACIDSRGASFDRVEYVHIDNRPGVEMVVGRQVSEQVLRALSVYSFSDEEARQLMSASYSKFLTCDLDENGEMELMLIQPGEVDSGKGIAVLYKFQNGEMARSREAELSRSAESVKRIMVSKLHGGEPAVYVASSVDESAIITDIFAMKYGTFTNISLSNDSTNGVRTMRNYYVYADDMDDDGVLELPDLIPMHALMESRSETHQHLIRWYSVDLYGNQVEKRHTFHNFVGGWYLELNSLWAEHISVIQKDGVYKFYIWDESFKTAELVFSIHTLTGPDREQKALEENGFVMYRTDSIVYAARLEEAAEEFEIEQDDLVPYFNLIHQDWKTGET